MRGFSIGTKIFLLSFAIGLVGLAVVCIAIVRHHRADAEKAFAGKIESFANVATVNLAPLLGAEQKSAAERLLKSVPVPDGVTGAILYDANVVPISVLGVLHADPAFLRENSSARTFVHDHQLIVVNPIIWSGRQHGKLVVSGDLEKARRTVSGELFSSLQEIIAAGIILSLVLAALLKHIVAKPVQELASAAADIAQSGDFSMRVTPKTNDESGNLANAFNSVLFRVESQEKQLRETREILEDKIRALAFSETRLKSVIESLAEALILVNPQGVITEANARALPVLGWEHRELNGRSAVETLFMPQDHAKARSLFEQARAGAICSAEMEITPPLGALRPVEVHCNRLCGENGELIGVLTSFLDIAERKRAADALATANAKLIDTSRRAGMAEIATNVLHNVGNAFNSVNVGLTLVTERLRDSRLSRLRTAVELIQKQGDNLPQWLGSNERGKHFVTYLDSLTSKLASNESQMLGELVKLDAHIDHIKNIISTQQSYAKTKATVERIPVARIVEHCLELEGSVVKSGILICVDIPRSLVIVADRHKTVQILCNLIRNARDAVREHMPEGGLIQIEATTLEARDRAIISVTDSGCGIAQENVSRIFAHGFTTKAKGHGFGLHASALAAMEMGGSLNATSDGPGLGSTFVLELPTPVELEQK
jgi:PAS domain S-box-containing protein